MALSKLAVKRLTKLADFMEKLPASANKHFDMGYFLSHNGEHKHEIKGNVTAKDLHTCGTTACALGWAATMPYFQRLGLTMFEGGDVVGDIEVFNISSGAWSYLFGEHVDVRTPKEWAKRCRLFIKENA